MRKMALVMIAAIVLIFNAVSSQEVQESKCQVPITAPKNIANVISRCQEEIKEALLSEAAEWINDAVLDNEHLHNRQKREVFSKEERRIAGCLLQCVYRKMEAVNSSGFPVADGLIALYTEGVTERNYVLATHKAVQSCLTEAQRKHLSALEPLKDNGKTCDIAFDVFDCVADRIGEYCGQTP